MSDNSAIEWTDATWNPVRGCTRVSPGCGGAHHEGGCYAEKIAARFSDPGQPFHGFAERTPHGGRWTGKVTLIEDKLTIPLRWKKPRRIFVNSMSDLFHESLPDEAIDRVFAVMALAPQHTFQVLTKRAERMRTYLSSPWNRHDAIGDQMIKMGRVKPGFPCVRWPLPNVWLGVSAERQQEWDERKEHLRATPAAIRFASFEPLLGTIIEPKLGDYIDWAITGGESGHNARITPSGAFHRIRDQSEASGVAYFHKQNGEYLVLPSDRARTREHIFLTKDWDYVRVGKKAAGRRLDGVEHNGFPA